MLLQTFKALFHTSAPSTTVIITVNIAFLLLSSAGISLDDVPRRNERDFGVARWYNTNYAYTYNNK
jgi:hypothetical protein